MDEIYFHPRDKHGGLKERVVHDSSGAQPAAEQTYEEAQLALAQFWANSAGVFNWPPEEYDRLKRELAVKYGQEEKAEH